MSILSTLRAYIPTIAKAVAALLTPVAMLLLAKAANALGVDVVNDSARVNEAIVAVVTAIAVYFTRNKTASTTEGA
jgi:predicted tellurium resistance membrane protein TerC